ncbi:hypothetical protein HPB50_015487 [Hyalomma asiaticum]|uniref:Uncharacterized protein n=1 Tax=Hyalomma asiaticum TaxID=266040 RepID=A0ACB7S3C6_HYAAI|nr:hypothetical protein HPB50_015487 [Hyalomma asiaticum]
MPARKLLFIWRGCDNTSSMFGRSIRFKLFPCQFALLHALVLLPFLIFLKANRGASKCRHREAAAAEVQASAFRAHNLSRRPQMRRRKVWRVELRSAASGWICCHADDCSMAPVAFRTKEDVCATGVTTGAAHLRANNAAPHASRGEKNVLHHNAMALKIANLRRNGRFSKCKHVLQETYLPARTSHAHKHSTRRKLKSGRDVGDVEETATCARASGVVRAAPDWLAFL